jgi:hypothetical protein
MTEMRKATIKSADMSEDMQQVKRFSVCSNGLLGSGASSRALRC